MHPHVHPNMHSHAHILANTHPSTPIPPLNTHTPAVCPEPISGKVLVLNNHPSVCLYKLAACASICSRWWLKAHFVTHYVHVILPKLLTRLVRKATLSQSQNVFWVSIGIPLHCHNVWKSFTMTTDTQDTVSGSDLVNVAPPHYCSWRRTESVFYHFTKCTWGCLISFCKHISKRVLSYWSCIGRAGVCL